MGEHDKTENLEIDIENPNIPELNDLKIIKNKMIMWRVLSLWFEKKRRKFEVDRSEKYQKLTNWNAKIAY